MMNAANSAAIGTAAVAASVRQAITTVAAISTANVMSAAPSCRLASTSTPAASSQAASANEDTPSMRPGGASGPNRKPDTISAATSAKPTTAWKACGRDPLDRACR